MYFTSQRAARLILGVTALACSRVMFAFFNDLEGPNLLVVIGMAAILYAASLLVYAHKSRADGIKKLLFAVFVQAIAATVLFVFMQ